MNFESTLEKIESSTAFANFKKQHKEAKLCAGFFIIGEGNQMQLDYCLEDGRIFTFILNDNGEVQMKEAETLKKQQNLPPIDKEVKVDLEDVEKILEAKLTEEKVTSKLNKVIAVLQKHEGKQIWNLNCMLANMEILRIHINSEDGEILMFEKKNMMDFIKRVK